MTLTDLDGTGFLCGRWACVTSETGAPAYEPDGTFDYNRHDDRFEQVMAYYWVTAAQKYIQSLGFGSTYPGINKDAQAVRINQWGVDNSFATDHPKDEMRFGKGGVDDAEDAEVILHEYGHQIHFSQSATFFDGGDSGADQRGLRRLLGRERQRHHLAHPGRGVHRRLGLDLLHALCPALPASARHEPRLPDRSDRRGPLRRPDLVAGAVGHAARMIGPTKANTAILLAQFGVTGPTMPSLATRIVAQVQAKYGANVAAQARAAFQARHIL